MAEESKNTGYSWCPYCLVQATARTRGIPTYDLGSCGHRWLASEGVEKKPVPEPLDDVLKGLHQIRSVLTSPHPEHEEWREIRMRSRVMGVEHAFNFAAPAEVADLLHMLCRAQTKAGTNHRKEAPDAV